MITERLTVSAFVADEFSLLGFLSLALLLQFHPGARRVNGGVARPLALDDSRMRRLAPDADFLLLVVVAVVVRQLEHLLGSHGFTALRFCGQALFNW